MKPLLKKSTVSLKVISGQANEKITDLKGKEKGRIAIIVAGGPSYMEAPLGDLKEMPGVDFIHMNRPDDRSWPPKYWCLINQRDHERFRGLLKGYRGTVISNARGVKVPMTNVIRFRMLHGVGFSRNALTGFYADHTSSLVAIQLAFYLGYGKIYIFGLDMCAVDGKLYGYKEPHPWNVPAQRIRKFESEAFYFLNVAQQNMTAEEKAQVTLCSPYNKWSFARLFRNVLPDRAVEEIKDAGKRPEELGSDGSGPGGAENHPK